MRVPVLSITSVISRETLGRVCFEVHCAVDQVLPAVVIIRDSTDLLAEHIGEGCENIEGFARVAVFPALVKAAAANLVRLQRLGAMFHQRIGPHVVVRTDQLAAERVHEREVPIATIAGAKQVLDQALKPLVTQSFVEVREKLFIFPWTQVADIIVKYGTNTRAAPKNEPHSAMGVGGKLAPPRRCAKSSD